MEPPRSIPGGGPPAFNQTECGAPIAERLAAITARSSPLGLDMADNSQQGEVIDDLKAAAGNEQAENGVLSNGIKAAAPIMCFGYGRHQPECS